MAEPTERIAILLELQEEEFQRRAKNAGAAIQRLERKFNPLVAAEAKLQKQQNQMNAAFKAGTIDMAQHTKGLNLVQREYDEMAARIGGARNNVVAMNSSVAAQAGFMTRNRAIFQQGGYQVGDFAVQVQGGTSALTAFTQQGSQLLGVFGPWGAVMGAVLAVGAPLAGFLLSGTEAGIKFEDALKGIEEVSQSLSDPLEMMNLSFQELTEKYGEAAEKVRGLIEVQAQLRVAMAEDALQGYVIALDGVLGQYTTLATGGRNLRNTLQRVQEDFGLSRDQAIEFSAALESLETAGTLDAQKIALQNILEFLEANNISLRKMPPAIQLALDQMISLSNESDRAAKIALELESSDFGSARIEQASSAAQELADWLGIALSEALKLSAVTPSMADEDLAMGQSVIPDAGQREANRRAIERYSKLTAPKKEGASGGKSKREIEPLFDIAEKELQAFRRQMEMLGKSNSEIAALTVKHKLLDEAKKRGLTITGELTAKIDAEAAEVGQLAEQYEMARDRVAAMEEIQGQFKDSVISAAMGGKDAMEQFTKSIKRAALEYLLFGEGMFAGGGGRKAGGFGGLLGGFLSFDGGGYTGSGSRSGGVDGKGGMPAIVHPRETIIDHTKVQSGSGRLPNQNVSIEIIAPEGFTAAQRSEAQNISVSVTDARMRAAGRNQMDTKYLGKGS